MKKLKNKNKGITLIALVITIIVMLILVAVTISMAVNGGLFDYARKATGEMQNAIDEEQLLAEGKIKIGDTWYNSIDEYLGNTEVEEGPVKISLSIAGTRVTEVPLPSDDFEHVEGTIDTGYVIEDEDGNQFVWVPVDKNQKITLKIESEKDIKEVNLIDPYGDEILTLADNEIETTYSNTTIEPTINGMYIAQVTTEEDELVEKTLKVKSLYAIDAWNDWSASEEFVKMQVAGTEFENLGKQEIWETMIEAEMGDIDTAFEAMGCKSLDQFITVMMAQPLKDALYQYLADYSESVKNNGGFYVARYEAGTNTARTDGNSNDPVATIISNHGKPVSKADAYPYNNVTFSQALGLAESMYETNDEYTVSLLTGSAWDRTLGWINETGDKTAKEIVFDSTSWGNYIKNPWKITKTTAQYFSSSENQWLSIPEEGLSKDDETSIKLTTGANNDFKANNIFDLAGNVCEWTNEPYSSDFRFSRGGHGGYGNVDGGGAAYDRIDYDSDGYSSDGAFRSALYLK